VWCRGSLRAEACLVCLDFVLFVFFSNYFYSILGMADVEEENFQSFRIPLNTLFFIFVMFELNITNFFVSLWFDFVVCLCHCVFVVVVT
jgi:hypothetical protein